MITSLRDVITCNRLIYGGHVQVATEIKMFLTSLALQSDHNCPTLHPRRVRYIMNREQCRRPLETPFISRLWISANSLFHLTSPLLPTGAVSCLVCRTMFATFHFMPIYTVDADKPEEKRQTQSRAALPLVCRVYFLYVIWLSQCYPSHLRNVSAGFWQDQDETGCEDVEFNSRRI